MIRMLPIYGVWSDRYLMNLMTVYSIQLFERWFRLKHFKIAKFLQIDMCCVFYNYTLSSSSSSSSLNTIPAHLSNNLIKKVQKPYPETARFPCNPNGPGKRSDTVPMSAHTVRPGDIDIVAAIGDSLTAGNGMHS